MIHEGPLLPCGYRSFTDATCLEIIDHPPNGFSISRCYLCCPMCMGAKQSLLTHATTRTYSRASSSWPRSFSMCSFLGRHKWHWSRSREGLGYFQCYGGFRYSMHTTWPCFVHSFLLQSKVCPDMSIEGVSYSTVQLYLIYCTRTQKRVVVYSVLVVFVRIGSNFVALKTHHINFESRWPCSNLTTSD